MKVPLVFLLLLPLLVHSELNNYKDFREQTPEDYFEQFDLIVNDTSVCEEETNRKLIVLASHFGKQDEFRQLLLENLLKTSRIYGSFLLVAQQIHTAKMFGQSILANRTQTAEEQHRKAILLEKKYALEMSALLDVCDEKGLHTIEEVIASSLRDPPNMKRLAAVLQEYVDEVQKHGYEIAQKLHFLPFYSRRDRAEFRISFMNDFPKAMKIHDHIYDIALKKAEIRSPVISGY